MRRVVASLFLCILLIMPACSHSEPPPLKNVKYAFGERNQLDFYMPDDVRGAPVIVFIHGGRWYRNDKSQIELYGRVQALTRAGFVIAAINHTYSSEALWPRQIEDVRAAIEFIKNEAPRYGYDGNRIGLWGQSSGAHLALMATMTPDETGASPINALVSWYGPTDLFRIRQDRIDDDVPGENQRFKEPSPETLLLGVPIENAKSQADEASPVELAKHLPADLRLPPILLVHGDSDFVISPLQTKRLYDELQRNSAAEKLKLRLVPGAGHGGAGFEAEVEPAVQFFVKHLRGTEKDSSEPK